MEVIFMVDIESTGISPRNNDLLQLGVLALGKQHGYWQPLRDTLHWFHTDRKPESEFAKIHMSAIYAACNVVPAVAPQEAHQYIIGWMQEVLKEYSPENKNKPILVGVNASGFDIPFLVQKGILKAQDIETVNGKDVQVGDYHYQVYEMQGAFKFALDVLEVQDRKAIVDRAFAMYPEIEMPVGKEHDALYDCYRQARTLNGLIRMLRGSLQNEGSKNLSNSESESGAKS